MSNKKYFEESKNGLSSLSSSWFYKGEHEKELGAKVFCQDGKWQYRIWTKVSYEDADKQQRWRQKGKGWKSLYTAFRYCLYGVSDVYYQLFPEPENKTT